MILTVYIYILLFILWMSFNDVCSSNDECSFKQCITCDIQENGPSDSEGTGLNEGIKGLVLILIIIILISICYCCCCYKKNIK